MAMRPTGRRRCLLAAAALLSWLVFSSAQVAAPGTTTAPVGLACDVRTSCLSGVSMALEDFHVMNLSYGGTQLKLDVRDSRGDAGTTAHAGIKLVYKIPKAFKAISLFFNFSIDIFKTVMDKPQQNPWHYELCAFNNCTLGVLDGAVGDVTITADQRIFFNPITALGFLLFTGFVMGMIERSINPVYQASSLTQFSTTSYFPFSTLKFTTHGQIIRSPLSKVVICCIAVLLLVQSYTAHLSSMQSDLDRFGFVFLTSPPLVNDGLSVADLNITEVIYGSCYYKSGGIFNFSYDELVDTIPSLKFDSAVGDVAINNQRVNYTEPYTESGGPLLARRDRLELIQWTFLTPLTKELWFATMGFFFFTAFVVWMIEKPRNPEFQGSSLTQCSTALFFAFSTLTFSHGQIIRSPLSKIVVVVWCFAVLVLVQTYAANLSSMLTAEGNGPQIKEGWVGQSEMSTRNASSTSGSVPLTLQSFSGLFVLTGCISALMLLISITRSVYAKYRVRSSESQRAYGDGGSVRLEEFSVLQIDTDMGNGSVPDQRIQEVGGTDSQDAHGSGGTTGDEEAGRPLQDIMSNCSLPEVSIQIEMTSTDHGGIGRAM